MLKVFARSERGYVRSDNQDRFLTVALAGGGWLVGVADGMGGHPGGADASHLALDVIRNALQARPHPVAELERAVKTANQAVFQRGRKDDHLMGMGTTLTLCQITPGEMLMAHVGDSRAYRFRAGNLERLTRDHSVAAELQEAGQLSAQEARVHPQRHILTRVVGPSHNVRVDLLGIAWHPSDRLLLCTDGLSGLLTDPELAAALQERRGQNAADTLVEAALTRGGFDNVTVVLVEEDETRHGW